MSYIQIATRPYRLLFRHPFRLAHGQRTGTDVVFVRMEFEGYKGYGEAALPPYLEDTQEGTIAFLKDPFFQHLPPDFDPGEVSREMARRFTGNYPGRAAVDMALWQLLAQRKKVSLMDALSSGPAKPVPHCYTIGVSDFVEMQLKLSEGIAAGFTFFKLKLDGECDREMVTNYLSLSTAPFSVDANQAWQEVEDAIQFSHWLQEKGCEWIEQPFHRSDREKSRSLMREIQIPVIADEACQYPEQLRELSGSFSGINIKLQKCGGISVAMEMIEMAREFNFKIVLGCMSESSVGCGAAEALAPLCDWADLDGPWLIRENPSMDEVFRDEPAR